MAKSGVGGGGEKDWKEIDYGDLEIGPQIGGGGFAIVYKGAWKKRAVAIKAIFDPRVDDQVKKEFMDELLVMNQVQHKNIVTMIGACVRPPKLCIVLELAVNGSLHEVLHTRRVPLSEKQIVACARDTATGLAYLHGRSPGIIHRDIKSQNLPVTDDFTIKLCDFGLASTNVTAAGTPSYMAPELLRSGLFSKQVDVYAFGVVMWEMVCRAVPFAGWDPLDIKSFVTDGKRLEVPRSGLPKPVLQLIERCWHEDPAKRPPIDKIARALDRVHRSMREVSHTQEMHLNAGGDSFDMLKSSVSSSRKK